MYLHKKQKEVDKVFADACNEQISKETRFLFHVRPMPMWNGVTFACLIQDDAAINFLKPKSGTQSHTNESNEGLGEELGS